MNINFSEIKRSSTLGTLLRLPLRLLPAAAIVPILQGPSKGTRWITGSSTHGCWLGSYEYAKQRVFQAVVRQGSVVYDIGANVGFYTVLASRLVGRSGRVYAFEPSPRNAQLLRQHIELNHIENVSILESAVSQVCGEISFDPGPNHSMGHLSNQGTIKVLSTTLDEFVFGLMMPAPHVVKIDVEGAEAEVLSGASMALDRYRPLVLLATHGAAVHRKCRGILRSHGYVVSSLNSEPVEHSDELLARHS